MKKYQIIWVKKDGTTNELIGSAASKAPNDITSIATSCGYINKFAITQKYKNKLLEVLYRVFSLIKAIKSCEKDSLILLQYPCFNEKIFRYIKYFLPKRNYVTVVHDLNSIRIEGKISKAEVSSLSMYNKIIVHTPEMKEYLSAYLPSKTTFYILECFPYLTKLRHTNNNISNEVCFAGNIDKSLFLNNLIPIVKNIKFKLYGKMTRPIPIHKNIEYCGLFNPDEISILNGKWGLVWDGISIDSCSGTWGNYLKIIAPHKFSLYIAACIPTIVWDQSAMARLIKKYGIGITISNLNELENKITSVSPQEYENIIKNILEVQSTIINGNTLKELLYNE